MADFRSDTLTKPTPGMLQAMMQATVGDDVFGEDPTVNQLEQLAARIFGMEAAIFCPSGTMTNQIAIKCHTQPGSEVICDHLSHIFRYEGGGVAFNSGCQVRPLWGGRGRITAEMIAEVINPDDVHKPVTRLVSVENTANLGGGSCYQLNTLEEIRTLCNEHQLKLHLDGARLFNALVAQKEDPGKYGELFDSISICLSKGLGAPVGSVLIGKASFIQQARRVRKVFGGGMRQAGYLAAAGIYALENHIGRLEEDHLHAKEIAAALLKKSFTGAMMPVDTNILVFEVKGEYTAAGLTEVLARQGVKVLAISANQIRIVTHLDISREMVDQTLQIIENL